MLSQSSNVKMPEKTLRNILELSSSEKRSFLDSFDIVLCDCDGVMWQLTGPIPGSGDGANSLITAGKDVYFVTNNSGNSDDVYLKKFRDIGFEPNLNNIIHPARSIIAYLEQIKFVGTIYCITSRTVENVLSKAGYKVISGPRGEHQDFKQFLDDILDDEPVRAVVIDFDINTTNAMLARAQLYLRNRECLLIAGATDKSIPLNKDISVIGSGFYLDILSTVSDKKPIILGKPGLELGTIVREKCKVQDPKRVLFIGDALEQDVGFGMKCGFQTLSVLTGISNKSEISKHFESYGAPDFYCNGITDFVQFFNSI